LATPLITINKDVLVLILSLKLTQLFISLRTTHNPNTIIKIKQEIMRSI